MLRPRRESDVRSLFGATPEQDSPKTELRRPQWLS
jgi:hypothetical protein